MGPTHSGASCCQVSRLTIALTHPSVHDVTLAPGALLAPGCFPLSTGRTRKTTNRFGTTCPLSKFVVSPPTARFILLQAAPRGVLQSEGMPTGDEEDTGPPLEEGGFLCFSGELSTEKAARVRSWVGLARAWFGRDVFGCKRCLSLGSLVLRAVWFSSFAARCWAAGVLVAQLGSLAAVLPGKGVSVSVAFVLS